jgi:TolB-like protein/cytochrome c-type biogenesis protein CcmH/NrfG
MEQKNKKDGLQAQLENITLDLGTYRILLHFQNRTDPLVIHFDKPARRFYFSLIALVVNEMKNRDKPEFIHTRKHEKTMKLLDDSLAGKNASKTLKGMWDKIRKAWRYTLPDLETGTHFKILERNLIPPYEKGGKYRYDCSDDECHIWANLFDYDENNPWRFKFALDSASLSLNDISLILGELRDNSAWQEFVKRLSMQAKAVSREKRAVPKWRKKAAFSLIAVLLVGAVTWAIWDSYIRTAPPTADLGLSDELSIAVLPFANMSGDPKQEYFSDGITEEIISALSRVPKLLVIARNSTFTYKGKPVKVQRVSKELRVRYVLEGSVRKGGNKIRITAQLIDALSGKHLWAERYDRNLSDIFAVQDEITKNIITAMQIKLTEGEQARATAKGTTNLEAYLKCLQANELIYQSSIEGNALGKQLAEEAIALDLEYAVAYRVLARAYMMDVWLGTSKSPNQSIAKAIELVQKALVLDDTYADAHGTLGSLYTMTIQYDKAVAQGEKAVALNPNSAYAYAMLGKTLRFAGRWTEAVQAYKKAIRLNPIPTNNILFGLGISYAYTGQYEEAIRWCEKAVHQQPDDIFAHLLLAAVYSFSGREEEARIQAAEVLRINPKFSVEKFAKRARYKNQADRERLVSALHKAGLK